MKYALELALGVHPLPERMEGLDPWATLERWIGPRVDAVLAKRCVVDGATRDRILERSAEAALQAISQVLREGEGDWAPDPAAGRFPDPKTLPTDDPKKSPDATNIYALAIEGRGPKTVIKYGRIFEDLLAFAKTRDTSRITVETIEEWKDSLLKRPGLTPRTIARDYLGAIRAILNCAVRTKCLNANPALGVSVEEARRVKPRKKRSFTDEEAGAILKAPLEPVSGRAKLAAAKRWVPWLCAYSGARVNEMTQVRRGDVRKRDGHWCVVITPDAGTQKTGDTHDVPLHEHLLEQGFLEFVSSHAMGEPLFHNPRPEGIVRKTFPSESTGKALATWVRSLGVTDEAVDPNHGWRHRFKTDGRFAEVGEDVISALQGHAVAGMSGRYGEFPARVTSKGIAKLPRLDSDRLRHPRDEDEVC